MSLNRFVKDTALYGLSSVLGRAINYLLVAIHTRYYDKADYGIISEIFAYAALLYILYTFGMETAFFKFYNDAQNDEDKNKVYSTGFWALLIGSVVLSIIFLCNVNIISYWLEYPQYPMLVVLLIGITFFDTLCALPFAWLRQQQRPLLFASIKLLNIAINIITTLYLLWWCPMVIDNGHSQLAVAYNPEHGIYYVFLANLLASAFTLVLLHKAWRNLRLQCDTKLLIEMLKYSLPLIIVGTAGIINETFDRILIKNFAPGNLQMRIEQNGIFSACSKLAILIVVFIQAFRLGAEPFFFRQSNASDSKEKYITIMDYFIMATSIIFLVICLYVDIWKYLIAEPYWTGMMVVPVLALSKLFLGIYYNQSVWYKLTKQTAMGAIIAIIGAAVTLVFNVLLIPKYGYIAAAYTNLASYFSMMLLSFVLGQKYYPIAYNIRKNATYIFVAVLTVGAFHYLKHLLSTTNIQGFLPIFLLSNLLIFIYLVVMYFIYPSMYKPILNTIKPYFSK